MADEAQDRADILALHKDWWEANSGLDIPRMAAVFPPDMNYLMFNLNGHPYFGINEKVELWKWYQKQLDIDTPDIRIMRLTIVGDMAWLGCEGVFPLRVIGESGTGSETWQVDGADSAGDRYEPFRLRATEIYQRDDGQGNPVWKMWHFHCSPLPPAGEPRPCFDDTGEQRGLGGFPGGQPERVVGV
ncbi:YybH family protein [Pseudonocardia sp. H11422]|uniref:YybH family protein n=1 Tax=Pseudonocardia sp. H11422 TaxID=2835866 RepID=UPI001BDC2735|nr:nuclear transport factor 2 family protein [Pseudonocardia sp. H11422]